MPIATERSILPVRMTYIRIEMNDKEDDQSFDSCDRIHLDSDIGQ